MKKVLLYSLGENINYFNMKVLFTNQTETYNLEVKQRFENGYGAIVDFNSNLFEGEDNPKIDIIMNCSKDIYMNKKNSVVVTISV